MTYSGTITTEPEIVFFEGLNVAAGGATEAAHNVYVDQAESYLSCLLREDVVAGFAGYSSAKKNILSEWAARYAALNAIAYDMVGFTTTIEAENMINIHWARMMRIEKLLLNQVAVTFLIS